MQGELAFAVEAAQLASGKVIQQAGGGDQFAAGQVTHADMPAVAIEIVHVQAQFGALQPSFELAAEYAVAQGLGFAQGLCALQAFGLKLACAAVDDGIHCSVSLSAVAVAGWRCIASVWLLSLGSPGLAGSG